MEMPVEYFIVRDRDDGKNRETLAGPYSKVSDLIECLDDMLDRDFNSRVVWWIEQCGATQLLIVEPMPAERVM
jgi:hypothetical protein